jgi:hypothetical protein
MRLGIASPPKPKTRYDYPPAILRLADSPRAERGPSILPELAGEAHGVSAGDGDDFPTDDEIRMLQLAA